MADEFIFPITVRYMEVDQQGVVFNAWYLTYFDDAMTALLRHGGLPYQRMLDAGYDVQLVRSEIDYRAGVRWGEIEVAVSTSRLGRTSFDLDFQIRQNGVVIGLEFNHPEGAKFVMRELYENGVWAIFSTLDPRVLQFKPGILVSRDLCEDVLDRLDVAVRFAHKAANERRTR